MAKSFPRCAIPRGRGFGIVPKPLNRTRVMLSCHPWQLSGRSARAERLSPHNVRSVPLEESGYFNPVRFFRFYPVSFRLQDQDSETGSVTGFAPTGGDRTAFGPPVKAENPLQRQF